VYFDTTDNNNGKTAATVPTLVSYQDNVDYEGQASYKVMTENATYYYHKLGAGFASMIDVASKDCSATTHQAEPPAGIAGCPTLPRRRVVRMLGFSILGIRCPRARSAIRVRSS